VGRFVELEEELAGFSSAGYTGGRSPNRADALIWGLAELFPGMIKATKPLQSVVPLPVVNRW
jgi:phage terminase large subunit-like protein